MSLSQEDREFIRGEDEALKLSLENRLTKVVLGQIVSALPVIFFLGGIYFEGREAVKMLELQQQEVTIATSWRHEQDSARERMEEWAIEHGYEPSQRPTRTYEQIKDQYNRNNK